MTTPAGLMLPTIKSYTNGTGNPQDSAMMYQKEMSMKQNDLNNSVGGKRRKHRIKTIYSKGGGANEIRAPQVQMPYQPQGGPGTNPNDQIKNLSSTSTQATAWKESDSLASKITGGRKKSRQKLKRRKNKNKTKTKKRRFTK
jgi:hypothetical protein